MDDCQRTWGHAARVAGRGRIAAAVGGARPGGLRAVAHPVAAAALRLARAGGAGRARGRGLPAADTHPAAADDAFLAAVAARAVRLVGGLDGGLAPEAAEEGVGSPVVDEAGVVVVAVRVVRVAVAGVGVVWDRAAGGEGAKDRVAVEGPADEAGVRAAGRGGRPRLVDGVPTLGAGHVVRWCGVVVVDVLEGGVSAVPVDRCWVVLA